MTLTFNFLLLELPLLPELLSETILLLLEFTKTTGLGLPISNLCHLTIEISSFVLSDVAIWMNLIPVA